MQKIKNILFTILCIVLFVALCMIIIMRYNIDEQFEGAEPPTISYDGLNHPKQIEMLYTEAEIIACANMLHYEYGSSWISYHEKAKVICTVCNRLKSSKWVNSAGDNIISQLSAPNQYAGYKANGIYTDYEYQIAYDVLWRDSQIQQGCEGIIWETDCCSFYGDGQYNYFY